MVRSESARVGSGSVCVYALARARQSLKLTRQSRVNGFLPRSPRGIKTSLEARACALRGARESAADTLSESRAIGVATRGVANARLSLGAKAGR